MKNLKQKSRLHPLKKFLLSSILAAGLTSIGTQGALAQQPEIRSIILNNPSTGSVTNRGYYFQNNPSVPTEKRLYFDGKHFLSILNEDGIFAIRPHPGDDVDGWGSTLYLQPFIAGATLNHTSDIGYNVINVNGTPKLRITANGGVSKGINETYGTWSTVLDFIYESSNKTINATGEYILNLTGNLGGLGDLNFYKLASNFLKNVPLVDGTIGDTGDLEKIIYKGDGFWQNSMFDLIWNPAVDGGGSFPNDLNTYLEVDAKYNNYIVDTVRQGYQAIAPATKPSLKVILQSRDSSMKVSFGRNYDTSQSTFFWADNIGVTPWVGSPNAVTNYIFDISLNSTVPSNDCYSSEITLEGIDSTLPAYGGVYFSSNMTNQFSRVGSIKRDGTNFRGKFKVNTKEKAAFFKFIRE